MGETIIVFVLVSAILSYLVETQSKLSEDEIV